MFLAALEGIRPNTSASTLNAVRSFFIKLFSSRWMHWADLSVMSRFSLSVQGVRSNVVSPGLATDMEGPHVSKALEGYPAERALVIDRDDSVQDIANTTFVAFPFTTVINLLSTVDRT